MDMPRYSEAEIRRELQKRGPSRAELVRQAYGIYEETFKLIVGEMPDEWRAEYHRMQQEAE
jgi:hypothetical protein